MPQKAAVAALTMLLVAGLGHADTVELKDGSRLVGVIQRLADGELKFETNFAGTLQIPMDQVASLTSDRPLNVQFETGDRLSGAISSTDPGGLVVKSDLGAVPAQLERVDAIWSPDDRSPDQLAAEMQLANTVAELQQEIDRTTADWGLTVEFGANYQEGNSDNLSIRGRVAATRESEKESLLLYVAGDYAEQDDVRNAASVRAGSNYKYKFTPRFFAFAETYFEWDEFENLDLRAQITGGPGYFFIKQEDHELIGQAGFGYQHESFFDGTTTDSAIMNLGVDYMVHLTEFLKFESMNRYYPTFNGLDDYRLLSDSAFTLPITPDEAWKLKLGALYQ